MLFVSHFYQDTIDNTVLDDAFENEKCTKYHSFSIRTVSYHNTDPIQHLYIEHFNLKFLEAEEEISFVYF